MAWHAGGGGWQRAHVSRAIFSHAFDTLFVFQF
jgi:hypothetical protein